MINSPHRALIAAVLWTLSGPQGGTARADDVQVNTYTAQDQTSPSVALDDDGNLVVVWASEGSGGSDTSGSSIQGQRFAAGGSTFDGESQANS